MSMARELGVEELAMMSKPASGCGDRLLHEVVEEGAGGVEGGQGEGVEVGGMHHSGRVRGEAVPVRESSPIPDSQTL